MAKSIYSDDFQIETFFSSEKETIDPALISNVGEKNITDLIAYLIKEVKVYDERKRKYVFINKELSINQLRKFYDNFLKIFNTKVDEKEKKIQLIMLKANAEYSAKRLTTNRFKEFISNRINLVVSQNTTESFNKYLNAFKLHFEALVAYYPKNWKRSY